MCFDDRDHIFGLLGLHARNQNIHTLHPLIRPDYIKSLMSVSRDAAVYIAAYEMHNLDILNDDTEPTESQDYLENPWPGWVPRWHMSDAPWKVKLWPIPRCRAYGREHRQYAPSQESLRSRSVGEDLLPTKGIEVDLVRAAFATNRRGGTLEVPTLLNAIHRTTQMARENGVSERKLALGLTLNLGTDKDFRLWISRKFTRLCTDWLDHLMAAEEGADEGKMRLDSFSSDELRDFHEHVENCCQNRSLFTTGKGALGLGPGRMQEGDIVAILWGCRWPVILRHDEGRKYRFMGVAYIYGMMDGEALSCNPCNHGEESFLLA